MDKELRANIRFKLRKLRIQSGHKNMDSFVDFAEIPKSTYERMEYGDSNFKIGTLIHILDFHKMTLSDFFSDLHKI